MKIIVYLLFLWLLYFAIKSERTDLFCPAEVKSHCGDKCGDGKGKYYIDGVGKDDDKVSTLLDKIQYTIQFDNNTVKWRRSLIISIIATILIYIIVLNKLPDGRELFFTTVIIFMLIYSSFSYYYFHYCRYPINYMNDNIERIRKKLKLQPGKSILTI